MGDTSWVAWGSSGLLTLRMDLCPPTLLSLPPLSGSDSPSGRSGSSTGSLTGVFLLNQSLNAPSHVTICFPGDPAVLRARARGELAGPQSPAVPVR